MSLLRLGSLLAVAVLLSACVASNKPAVRTSAQTVSETTKTAPLAVDQIVFDIRRGESIGTTKGPMEGCLYASDAES